VAFLSLSSGVDGVFVGGNGGPGGSGGPGGEGGAGGNGFGFRVITREGTDRTGFVGGVGAEVKLSPQVGAGVEALYYAFDRGRGDFNIRNLETLHDFVTVSGRLTFYFNDSDTPHASSAPVSFPSDPWAGFYVGGHIGALHNMSDRSIDSVALANGEPGSAGVRGIDAGGGGGGAVAFAGLQRNAAIMGGAHIGYNWHSPALLLGAEADADASSNDSNRYFGSVRGRLGWTNRDYLFYGTAGIAVVRDESFSGIFAENGGPGGNGGVVATAPGAAGGPGGRALAFGADDTRVGFVIGAGLETQLSNRVSAGLEGLYYAFQNRTNSPLLPDGGRAFVAGNDANDAFVVRTRFSFALQP
jgi:opacity protein-like surface antigen